MDGSVGRRPPAGAFLTAEALAKDVGEGGWLMEGITGTEKSPTEKVIGAWPCVGIFTGCYRKAVAIC